MIIKKGNKVKILNGKDKNKEGEIIELDRSKYRAKVKGLNLIKKHVKTTKEKKGGIFEKENFVHLSNLSIITDNKKTKKVESKKWYHDWKNYIIKKYKLI
mgnify:FL=1